MRARRQMRKRGEKVETMRAKRDGGERGETIEMDIKRSSEI